MPRFKFGMFAFAMSSGASIGVFIFLLTACGPSAPEYHPGESRTLSSAGESSQPSEGVPQSPSPGADSQASSGATVESSGTPSTENKTPAAAPLMPPRTVPNAAEKTAMTNLYAAPNNQGGCAGCHGALDASAKKGRTAQQIANSQTILQHRNVAAANKWPKDTADTSNDGVDNAQLYLSAMVEILK